MNFASIAYSLSGLSLIVAGIFLTGGNLSNFLNMPGIMIVLGGTIACTFFIFPIRDVVKAFQAAFFVLYKPKVDPNDTVKAIIKLSNVSRRQGFFALDRTEINNPLLKKGFSLIADGAEEDIISNALRTEIESRKYRHLNIQNVFVKMATFSPAFGMMGTLIGLVQMLNGLSDPSSIGPAMAVALLTTLYGSILSTLFFLPIASKLKARAMTEVINMEIIFEGIISILKKNHRVMVFERLSSFIPFEDRTISAREGYKL
ncbi:MAG: MotA/TolQ/ExbB proton channel family protein [Desulfatiglandales bacterium]